MDLVLVQMAVEIRLAEVELVIAVVTGNRVEMDD